MEGNEKSQTIFKLLKVKLVSWTDQKKTPYELCTVVSTGLSRDEGHFLPDEKSLMFAEADVPNMFHSWEWSRPAIRRWKMDLRLREESPL